MKILNFRLYFDFARVFTSIKIQNSEILQDSTG